MTPFFRRNDDALARGEESYWANEATNARCATDRLRAEVDRQLARHLCYTSVENRKTFWQAVDAVLAADELRP